MTQACEADENAIALAFLRRFEVDLRARGAARKLAEYQAEVPGFELEVAREHAALEESLARRGCGAQALGKAEDHPRGVELGAGRYRSCGEQLRGGMGVVSRVRDERLEREVALKVLAPRQRGSVRAAAQLLEEARITSRLHHPGIPAVHDFGIDELGEAYFTMAWIEGRDFGAIIAAVHAGDPDWPMVRALRVLQRVAEIMTFAHAHGIVHCDLKPGNLRVDAAGEPFVLDWGLACDLSSPSDREGSALAEVRGTPAYMAPEQARGQVAHIDERTDVYALGALLYHLLAGAAPYGDRSSSSRTAEQILALVQGGGPAPLHDRRPDTPPLLAAICERAMQRAKDLRYPSAVAFGGALEHVVSRLELGEVLHAPRGSRRCRKRRLLALVVAAAAMLRMLALA